MAHITGEHAPDTTGSRPPSPSDPAPPPDPPEVPGAPPEDSAEPRGCLFAVSQPPLMIFLTVIGTLLLIAGLHDQFWL